MFVFPDLGSKGLPWQDITLQVPQHRQEIGDQKALDYFTLSPPLWASDRIVHSEIFWGMIGTLAHFLLQESE